jgi:hypothetical protein
LTRLPETGELCQTAFALGINIEQRRTNDTDKFPQPLRTITRSQSDRLCWLLNSDITGTLVQVLADVDGLRFGVLLSFSQRGTAQDDDFFGREVRSQ